jgi:1-deoxy-D-xylulose-5-phosphate synthase
MVVPCYRAAESLAEEGIECSVVNARFAKPLDQHLLCSVAGNSKLVVTVEENAAAGGFGSLVAQLLHEKGMTVPTNVLGLPDRFIAHGTRQELLAEVGLSADGIATMVKTALSRCA